MSERAPAPRVREPWDDGDDPEDEGAVKAVDPEAGVKLPQSPVRGELRGAMEAKLGRLLEE